MKTLLGIVAAATVAYIGTLLLVTALDPTCGPDGYSQKVCIEEFNHDIANLFNR